MYRPTYTMPIPAGAVLSDRDGQCLARFRRNGRMVTAPVTKRGRHAGRRVTVEARNWAIEYTDAGGHVRRVKGYADKGATLAKAAELTRAVERERAGIIDQQSIDLSASLKANIDRHVDAYETHLRASGVSAAHLSETLRRLRRIVADCGFTRLAGVTAEPVQRWLGLRESEGMGARTRNTYTASLRAFIRWAVADGRMVADPLGTLRRADEAGDRRRERRALTEDELLALLRVAELRPLAEHGRESIKREENPDGKPGPLALEPLTLANIDAAADRAAEKLRLKPAFVAKLRRLGRERGLIYRTLVLTGLRRGELAALLWGDLSLDGKAPTLTVRAAVAKNRKAETLPIRADLAESLRAWRADCGDGAASGPVFRVPKQLVCILDRDLVAAGIARRVKAKDRKGRDCWRIDTRDADGRTVDVHALRHTTATYLAKAGVAPRTAQTIMRHSDIRLTLGTYTDPRLLDTAAALDALPSMDAVPDRGHGRATGTDSATATPPAGEALGVLLGGKARQASQNGST
ncbi:MAG: tyrosine-type recombinase/integrase [Phycisphaerae bacterium]